MDPEDGPRSPTTTSSTGPRGRLAEHHGIASQASVSITKAIPVAGGMAGGSADAAAALVALDRLWKLRTSDDDLLALADAWGATCRSRWWAVRRSAPAAVELVKPVPDPATWWWVAVPSPVGLSTPAVYRALRRARRRPAEPLGARAVLLALSTGDPEILASALHNDLRTAALSTCVPTSATCWG